MKVRGFLVLLAAAAWAQDDDEIRAMAANVRHYPTKFKLIELGKRAVPALMDQVSGKDAWLAFESTSALRYIALHAAKDPSDLANVVSVFVDKKYPKEARTLAAEMLGDLKSVAPLRSMLADESVRAAAVEALTRIPGKEAFEALDEIAKGFDEDVLRALGKRHDKEAAPVLVEAAASEKESVARAAIQALGDLGDPAVEGVLLATARREKLHADAYGALLKLGRKNRADAMLCRALDVAQTDDERAAALEGLALTGNVEKIRSVKLPAALRALVTVADTKTGAEAQALYREVLEADADEAATLRALVRVGEASIVTRFLKHSSARVRSTAVVALRETKGEEATRALAAELAKAEGAFLFALIDALGERRDPAAIPSLEPILLREDPKVGVAAARALGRIGDAAAEPALWKAIQGNVEAIRGAASEAYLRIAGSASPERARTMYHRLLGADLKPTMLREALAGLTRVADGESVPILERFLEKAQSATREAALKAYVSAGDRLAASGKRAEAVAVFRKALDQGAVADLENKLRALGEKVELTAQEGRIDSWWIIGSADGKDFPGREIDLARWKPTTSRQEEGYVELDSVFKSTDNAFAYAEVVVKKAVEATLKSESGGELTVWINSVLVADPAKIKLNEGTNTILLKVCRGKSAWGFAVRLRGPDGKPLRFKIR